MTFILLDDDQISNIIHKRIITNAWNGPAPKIISFVKSQEVLDFILSSEKQILKKDKVILLLDLNMPEISGWEFLERLKNLTQSFLSIYILTSSVAKADIEKSKKYSSVKGYLLKPLSIQDIHEVIKTEAII